MRTGTGHGASGRGGAEVDLRRGGGTRSVFNETTIKVQLHLSIKPPEAPTVVAAWGRLLLAVVDWRPAASVALEGGEQRH